MPGGRPPTYGDQIVKDAWKYIQECIDTIDPKSNKMTKVKIPTKGGLAVALGVSRDTLYDWAKIYPEFSDIMEQLGAIQEERLINNALGGDYSPIIAKVLLTKHGYREGIDKTTNDKDIIEKPTDVDLDALAKKMSDELKKAKT